MRRQYNNRPPSDDSDENLRGKVRDLQKQLREARRQIKSLQSKGSKPHSSREEQINHEDHEKPNGKVETCPNCGKEDTLSEKTIWSPNGDLVWNVCEVCKYRERTK